LSVESLSDAENAASENVSQHYVEKLNFIGHCETNCRLLI
jgi:hypothetical protein